MTFNDLSLTLQTAYELSYEYQAKLIILGGALLFALFYIWVLYPNQKPTKLILYGTIRGVLYFTSILYAWGFFLIFPVYINPQVGIDSLLIFLASTYTIIITVATVLFIFNATIWIPKYFIRFGKIDINSWERNAIDNYFKNWGKRK